MPPKGKFNLIGIVAVAVIVILGIVVATFDWNLLRGFISNRVSAATGRDFAINGDLDVRLGITPTIRAEQVALGNAPWASSREMADIDVLEFRINLWQLMKGNIVIPMLSLTRPSVMLEQKEGKNNWTLGKKAETKKGPEDKLPTVGQLNIRDGVVYYREPNTDTFIKVNISTLPTNPGQKEELISLRGSGRLRGQDFSLRGQGGSLLSLRSATSPYPIDIEGRTGETRVAVKGTLLDPLHLKGMNVSISMQGPDLSKLADITGMPIPATRPYTINGRLDHQDEIWRVTDFRGTLGDSKLTGDAAIDLGGKQPLIQADLVSERLDLDDLAGLTGAPPKPKPGEPASAEQRRLAAQAPPKRRVFPDKPYNLARLRSADADIRFRATHIKVETVRAQDLTARVVLQDGQLRISPLDFGVADGSLVSKIAMNAQHDTPVVDADLTVKGIKLHKLFPKIKVSEEVVTQFGGRAMLSTKGNSLADMAAAADGELGLVMSGGWISNLLLEIVGIDGGEALKFFLGGDKEVPMRCAVADFKINDGVMKTNTFVIDTTDTNIIGNGTIDLSKEVVDLTLETRPKDPSIFASRAPLYVAGTLKSPDFSVDKTVIAGRIGAAVALGILATPLAALVPLIETGPGKDTNCAALFAKESKKRNTSDK